MTRLRDLTGKTFGRLTVLRRYGSNKSQNATWLCRCTCGEETVVPSNRLTSGRMTVSCGCLKGETNAERTKEYCSYNLEGDYGVGYTHNGTKFLFDKEDYELLKDYCWYLDKDGYLQARNTVGDINVKKVLMHRLVMGYPQGLVVDHKSRDKFDNRKENLRAVTQAENTYNKSISSQNKSGVIGVSFLKNGRWLAHIQKQGKQYKKTFDKFEDAIKWRLDRELELFGSYSPNSMDTLNKLKYTNEDESEE